VDAFSALDTHFEEVRRYLAGTRGSNNNPVVIIASLQVPEVMTWVEEVEAHAVAFSLGHSACFSGRLSTAARRACRAGIAAAYCALETTENGVRGLANPRVQAALLGTARGAAARGNAMVHSVDFVRNAMAWWCFFCFFLTRLT
jgi:hypothetical protein